MAPKNKRTAGGSAAPALLDYGVVKRLKSALNHRKGDPVADELAQKYADGSHEEKEEILARFVEDIFFMYVSR